MSKNILNNRYKIKSEFDILNEYRRSDLNKFESVYKIKINTDGSIYDLIFHLPYNSILSWAQSLKQINEEYKYNGPID